MLVADPPCSLPGLLSTAGEGVHRGRTCCTGGALHRANTQGPLMAFVPQNFEVKADDLEPISELGRGAYGVVEKMRHMPSGQIMAVKVE